MRARVEKVRRPMTGNRLIPSRLGPSIALTPFSDRFTIYAVGVATNGNRRRLL